MPAEIDNPTRTGFDHEKLDVYRLSLDFVAWTASLLGEVKDGASMSTAAVRGQLDRAALSNLLNIAEGNAKRRPRLRARFLEDARGSATECAACLDAMAAMEACPCERLKAGKQMLVRVVSMLTKMIDRLDRLADRAGEGRPPSTRANRNARHENEHEHE